MDKPERSPYRSAREQIEASEKARAEAAADAKSLDQFDLRRIIGALFVVYGLVLLCIGLFGSNQSEKAGYNVNLWTGLAMLVFAALMWWWALARPLSRQLEEEERELAEIRRRSEARA
jgi:Flp pilus assembly protein TadB